MSAVNWIGTRTIEPLTCGNHPDDDDVTEYAQQLLNTIAGSSRVRVDGVLGRETASALRNFQASAGLPETGALDAATVGRLETEAERALMARGESLVDDDSDVSEVEAEPEPVATPRLVPTTLARTASTTEAAAAASTGETASPETIAGVRRGLAVCTDRAALREELAELAPRFGVTRGRSTRTREETIADQANRLSALFRRVNSDAEVGALALNIERVSRISGVDPALSMSVMSMEGSDALTARSVREVDVWHDDWNRTIGNMVHDRDLAHRPGVEASGSWRTVRFHDQDDGSTTGRVEHLELWGAFVPERDMPLLTAAQLATYEEDFEATAREVVGEHCLDSMSLDARRTWVQLRFSGVGNLREALERVRDAGGDMNAIVESPELGRDIHVAIARVRAMRAALFEETFDLPPPGDSSVVDAGGA